MNGAGTDGLAGFGPATRDWFRRTFPDGPTPVQTRTWRAVARGENVLAIAPTGSGKTLAAFLSAIDHLTRAGTATHDDAAGRADGTSAPESPAHPDDGSPSPSGSPDPDGGLAPDGALAPGDAVRRAHGAGRRSASRRHPRGVRVLYLSPLKALGVDVERNLRRPLAGIDGAGTVTTGIRSGDTPARERRRLVTHPPDILITTPESLYLMLTSAARQTLRTVETVIVDEVHALAGDKRGAHLALSLERLDDLLPHPAQRLGLSATVAPREEVAHFLGGTHPVTVIADDAPPVPDLTVAVPVADMRHVPTTADRADQTNWAAQTAPRAWTAQTSGGARTGPASRSGGGSRTGLLPPGPVWRTNRGLARALADGAGSPTAVVPPGPGAGQGAGPAFSAAGMTHQRRLPSERTTTSIWPHIEQAVLDQVLTHRSTLVFVNSRGACERLTAHLNEAYAARTAGSATVQEAAAAQARVPHAPGLEPGRHRESWEAGDHARTQALPAGAPVIAMAHHGSVSKEQRAEVEAGLKEGRLRCVVATASLELGIDMGAVDLVIQVVPPPSVASGLQRVGRADHRVGGHPRGIVYPVTRTQLVDAAVGAEGMAAGAVEHTTPVANALDVLAQQTVAAVAVEDRTAAGWYATVRRAAPYRDLPREAFDAVLTMLTGGYTTTDLADFSPALVHDPRTDVLSARPGAQRRAVTSAGTIPDRGMFPVVLPEGDRSGGRRRVGELDEEMVNESAVGDVLTLGTSSWRIREITGDRVVVDPAAGRSSRLPFWRGEGAGRPTATGAAKGAFLREVGPLLGPVGTEDHVPEPLAARLRRAGLDANARTNLVALLREQRAATTALPTDTTVVLERHRDETGSWRLVVHSARGRGVHAPWALAIRERARQVLGVEPQTLVSDDGIVLQLPATVGSPPGPELVILDPGETAFLVRSQVEGTALFAARFRECAARALLMRPSRPGRRTPLWLQRLRSAELLQASRNLVGFPLLVEAARECLRDVYDLPALTELLTGLATGAVQVVEATTPTPSPFAQPLLMGYSDAFLYQGDLPQAERREQLLSLDPDLLASLLGDDGVAGVLDAEVMAQVEAELQRLTPRRRARADAEGVADLLRELGPLDAEELAARCAVVHGRGGRDASATGACEADGAHAGADGPNALATGLEAGNPEAVLAAGGPTALVTDAVRRALAELAGARRALEVGVGGRPAWVRPEDARLLHEATGLDLPAWVTPEADGVASQRPALEDLLARHARTHAQVTVAGAARALGAHPAAVEAELERLTQDGQVLRLGGGEARWMDAGVLRRVRSRSLARARAAVVPVQPAALQRLVLERSGAAGLGGGVDALAEALAGLEGVWLPASLWEQSVLPARVAGYAPPMLDELITSGEVVWQARSSAPDDADGTARTDLTALAQVEELAFFPTDSPLAPVVGDAVDPGAIGQAACWDLARTGGVTGSTLEPVRRSLAAAAPSGTTVRRVRSRHGRRAAAAASRRVEAAPQDLGPGRLRRALASASWSRLVEPEVGAEERAVAAIESLLDRLGVVTADGVLEAGVPGGLASLLPVLRRMEDTGTVLRGVFVEGLGPSQFAARETVDRLRALDAGRGAARGGARGLGPAAAPGAAGRGQGGERGDGRETLVVLDLRDPACLVGGVLAWPEATLPEGLAQPPHEAVTAPARRRGTRVVLAAGTPVLAAGEGLRLLTSFTRDRGELARAAAALVADERRRLRADGSGGRRRVRVESVNGLPAIAVGVSDLLAEAGLVREPQGMRLVVDPYGRF